MIGSQTARADGVFAVCRHNGAITRCPDLFVRVQCSLGCPLLPARRTLSRHSPTAVCARHNLFIEVCNPSNAEMCPKSPRLAPNQRTDRHWGVLGHEVWSSGREMTQPGPSRLPLSGPALLDACSWRTLPNAATCCADQLPSICYRGGPAPPCTPPLAPAAAPALHRSSARRAAALPYHASPPARSGRGPALCARPRGSSIRQWHAEVRGRFSCAAGRRLQPPQQLGPPPPPPPSRRHQLP